MNRRCRLMGRAGRWAALVGLALLLVPMAPARAAAAEISQYEGRAEGSVMRFLAHMPYTGVPLTVTGGAFDSTVVGNSLPEGLATAGSFPVPAGSSFPLLVPQELPAQIRDTLRGMDFTNTPNYCQAAYPPAKPGLDEGNCGGPQQGDGSAPFTAAIAHGHAKVTGDLDQPLDTRSLAESQGVDVTIPALQVVVHEAWSEAVSALNSSGVPQGELRAEAGMIDLLGGKVKLGNILSETTVVDDGTAAGQAAKTTFSLGSATVMDVPVHVGEDGFTVASQQLGGDSTKSLTEALNKSAGIQGFSMRLFPAPPVSNQNGLLSAESGGVEISYIAEKPIPAHIIQRYGYTSASVTALSMSSAGDTDSSSVATSVARAHARGGMAAASEERGPTSVATVEPPSGGDGPLATSPPSFDAPSSAGAAGGQGQGGTAPGVVTSSAAGEQARLGESLMAAQRLDPDRLRILYLGLAVLLIACPVAFRLRRAI